MAARGMGVVYLRRHDGSALRADLTQKAALVRDYYEPHHRRLEECVFQHLRAFGVERLLSTATVFHQFLCHTNWFRMRNARRFASAPTPFTRPIGFPRRWSPRSRDSAIV